MTHDTGIVATMENERGMSTEQSYECHRAYTPYWRFWFIAYTIDHIPWIQPLVFVMLIRWYRRWVLMLYAMGAPSFMDWPMDEMSTLPWSRTMGYTMKWLMVHYALHHGSRTCHGNVHGIMHQATMGFTTGYLMVSWSMWSTTPIAA